MILRVRAINITQKEGKFDQVYESFEIVSMKPSIVHKRQPDGHPDNVSRVTLVRFLDGIAGSTCIHAACLDRGS